MFVGPEPENKIYELGLAKKPDGIISSASLFSKLQYSSNAEILSLILLGSCMRNSLQDFPISWHK
ncbi:hypothetical protein swp_2719 [Shewanella piezotolerans WP3]|uniref:Uncharacterized protein n=1 Tax=Shewanella piezotolerans (strain WP3 / JCM 13877) TaxID=225849 RepID=B8CMR1_SHEPW|nr:hypothetical protein swp_2719 [Shewanella piezotolerans WP3]